MELSPSQQETIRHQFDSFSKKVLREERRDSIREEARYARHEISLSILSPSEFEQSYTLDEYSADYRYFSVLGYKVEVKDHLLSTALTALTEQKRDIILLSYFLDMTDREIGETLNIVRSTVQYIRTSSLKQLKKLLEEKADE